MVSKLYQFLVIPDRFSLPVERVWEKDCPELDEEFDWHDVWSDISQVSRNPDHQQIHYNFIHRTYLTPARLHHMKFVNEGAGHISSYDMGLPSCQVILEQCCIQIIYLD